MTAIKKSWMPWFGKSTDDVVEDDTSEAARAIITSKTPEEQIEVLRFEFESRLAELEASYEARFEALPKQFETWLDSYTAPKSKTKTLQSFDLSTTSKPDVPEDLKRLRWALIALHKRMSIAKITQRLNGKHSHKYGSKLCSSTQIGTVIKSPFKFNSGRQNYNVSMRASRVQRALPLVLDLLTHYERSSFEKTFLTTKTKQTHSTNTLSPTPNSRPPKPELTGDYKRINWILLHLRKRFTCLQIANHISDFTKRRGGFDISRQTVRNLSNYVYVWNAKAWYPVLREDKLPLIIQSAHQLLTSAEQAQYNEMFGAPNHE